MSMIGRMTPEKKKLGINADQTNPGDPADADKFSETVYKLGGIHRGPKGAKYSYKAANSEEELESLIDRGWSLDFQEALFGKKEEKRGPGRPAKKAE